MAIYRNGTWWIQDLTNNQTQVVNFGISADKPVAADYDGDGRADMAVFRPSTATWWILCSSDDAFSTTVWGIAADKPVPADYDGDGRTDIAVYRNGTWYVLQSSNGQVVIRQFGLSTDIPIAGANQ